jgi:hypothetical protein
MNPGFSFHSQSVREKSDEVHNEYVQPIAATRLSLTLLLYVNELSVQFAPPR